MESVTNFMVDNYGVLGVFVIIIGFLAFFIIKELRASNSMLVEKQHELNKELNDSITKSLTGMTANLTAALQSQNDKLIDHIIHINRHDAETHKENVLERIAITEDIKEKLKELTILSQATRGLVLEFHNSFENLSGFPFAKYTCTYEYVTKGVIPIMQNISGLQFSSISGVVERIFDKSNTDHIVIAHNAQELEEISPIMESFIKNGSESILWKGIFNTKDHMLIGLLALEFRHGIPDRLNKTEIKMSAAAIAELITLSQK